MRRALLVAVIALPIIVLAAVAAGSGQVVEIDNFNVNATTSYLNAAQCAGTAPVRLEWNIVLDSGQFTSGNGTYQIFASDTAPPTTGDNANFCPEKDDTTKSPQVFANRVDTVTATSIPQRLDVLGSDIKAAVHATCDSSSEGKVLYVCSHWFDSNSTRRGHASGKFLVQIAAPARPTTVTVAPGDTRLKVAWKAGEGGTVDADHYVAEAATVAGGAPVASASTDGPTESVTISGLQNGTTYFVVVRAYSVGGNPSAASDPPATGTPEPVNDFWETYRADGGREQGGCASGAGAAGALGLLGAASLVALRRRK